MPRVRGVPHGGSPSPRLGQNVETVRHAVCMSRVDIWEEAGGERGRTVTWGVWTCQGAFPLCPVSLCETTSSLYSFPSQHRPGDCLYFPTVILEVRGPTLHPGALSIQGCQSGGQSCEESYGSQGLGPRWTSLFLNRGRTSCVCEHVVQLPECPLSSQIGHGSSVELSHPGAPGRTRRRLPCSCLRSWIHSFGGPPILSSSSPYSPCHWADSFTWFPGRGGEKSALLIICSSRAFC